VGFTFNGDRIAGKLNDLIIGGRGNDSLNGLTGADYLDGRHGDDTLNGGVGNDTMLGGAGDDKFVLSPDGSADTIADFIAGAASGDRLDLTAFTNVPDLAAVLARATQTGADTRIDFGGGSTVLLKNVLRTSLTDGDFIFRPTGGSPEIAVAGNSTNIADGDTTPTTADFTDFGSALQGGGAIQRTFTVTNTGTAVLTTSGLTLPTGFTLVEGLSTTIAAGGFDTFQVRLDTTAAGTKSGEISFTTNDSNESPFNFSITGTVNPPAGNDDFADSRTDTSAPIGQLAFDTPRNGTIETGGDLDWFSVSLVAGQTYTFRLQGEDSGGGRTLNDPYLRLYGSTGLQVAFNDDAGASTYDSQIVYKAKATGIHYLQAADYSTGATGTYTISATGVTEVAVSGNGYTILNKDKTPSVSDQTDFGSVSYGSGGVVRTFTVHNLGAAPLNTSNLVLPSGFTLVEGLSSTIAAGNSDTFQVRLDTGATGARTGIISFTTNDSDENPYSFTIKGAVTAQVVTGHDGDNTFVAQAHAEAFAGLLGTDTVSYVNATGGVLANLLSAVKNTGFAAGDTYNSIENLIGSAHADTLTGNAGNNVIEGGGGADKIDGGAGIDTASYANASARVSVDMLIPADNEGDAVGDTFKQIEGLLGSAFGDFLAGNKLVNVINGGAGDDTIYGDAGADTLTGGAGFDSFNFGSSKEGSDTISDFSTAADIIGIYRPGFLINGAVDLGAGGDFDFALHYFVSQSGGIVSATNPSGVAATETGHGQFLFNRDTDKLWWDADGLGKAKAVLLASFATDVNLQGAHFDLYG
jgi:Ca2+-binding RTX toxin-like protein